MLGDGEQPQNSEEEEFDEESAYKTYTWILAPLPNKEILPLIERAQKGDTEAEFEVVRRNGRAIISRAGKIAQQKAGENVYTFIGTPDYPITVTGGWIDVDGDANTCGIKRTIGTGDFSMVIELDNLATERVMNRDENPHSGTRRGYIFNDSHG